MKRKDKKVMSTPQWGMVLIAFCLCCFACSQTPAPDLERLKADLEGRLIENKGDTTRGNADIYSVATLSIREQSQPDENSLVLAFEGEVACLTGFYTSEEGRYSRSKPEWKAKRHMTKGARIGFSGKAVYRLEGRDWSLAEFSSEMAKSYAPPL